jgi:carboxyl-terminal processing protease
MRAAPFIAALACFLLFSFTAPAQDMKDAFLITRMAERYHLSPRPVDDSLSAAVFTTLLNKLDPDKDLFTQKDIAALEPDRYRLDDQIRQRNPAFAEKVALLYRQRLELADTLVTALCSKPFNLALAETFTVQEQDNYPQDRQGLQLKLYKYIKWAVLQNIAVYLADTVITDPSEKTHFIDSLEQYSRRKYHTRFRRFVQSFTQKPGGVNADVMTAYCEAIAASYDPHTNYLPQTEKENFDAQLGRKAMVLGFTLEEDANGNPVIGNLKPGSPAYKSGQLNRGDRLMTIRWEGRDAVDVSDAAEEEISYLLAASNHDKVNITVKKADGSMRTVTLVKEQSNDAEEEEKVKSFVLKGAYSVGYIALPAFYIDWENGQTSVNGCANDVARAIINLKKADIKALVVDLRYNGGGSVEEAAELAGLFIDAGPVAQFKTREPKAFSIKDVNRGTVYDGPLFIMVNGFSASASEMLAAALQDYHRAVIVGTPTYGKATGQVVLPLDTTINPHEPEAKPVEASSYLKVTTSKLYRVTGETAQFKGVKPDILLPDATLKSTEKEAAEPFALRPDTIAPNRYYQPLPSLPLAALQETAATAMAANPYFKELQQQQPETAIRPISLTLAAAQASLEATEEEEPSSKGTGPAAFTVEQLAGSTATSQEKDAQKSFRSFLQKDPALQVVYALAARLAR